MAKDQRRSLLRRLAAAFRFRLTLGFSKRSRRFASDKMPYCCTFRVKRRSAASKLSFSRTITSVNS
jgi:hypothetical protein